MAILFAVLLFSFLIFIHELGHFVAAKLSGVQVNEFSVFMGPAIFKKQIGETLYAVRCIPVGGYCAMEGEDEDSDNPRSFQKAAWWKRLIILVAGSAMNLIVGFLLAAIVNACLSQVIPQVDYLRSGSTLAWEGGLQAGDVVLEMDGRVIGSTGDFTAILQEDPTVTQFDVLVSRNGTELLLKDVTMIPQEFQADAEGEAGTFYGIQWATRRLTLGEALVAAWDNCVYFVKLVWMSLGMLFSGEARLSDMSGPVGIVAMMNDTAQASATTGAALLNLMYLGAFIAVNLAVMNMLPIPALDGGRSVAVLLTAAIEAVTKKKIDPKYEAFIHGAGMILLLILMAVIFMKDIFVIFKG